MSDTKTGDVKSAEKPHSGPRRRWVWGLGILIIACIAQGILWNRWWDDPTHFKMSILFVWPAALFALTIWWLFFSGWPWWVRVGLEAVLVGLIGAFFYYYRIEWDGDMAPHRVVLRTTPTAEDVARDFLKQLPTADESKKQAAESVKESLKATEGDWPGFRGPFRDGIVRNGSLRRDWEKNPPREIWRHPVGRAWSSFAIVGNYAFTQEQRGEMECVVAYHFETGEQIWVHEDPELLSIIEAQGGPGPHATPQFDQGLLYTLGGTGLFNCLDAATGKRKWRHNIIKMSSTLTRPHHYPEWGVSNSPLIAGDNVIVIAGGTSVLGPGYNQANVVFEKTDGEFYLSWGSRPASYGSPKLVTLQGAPQVLVPTGDGIESVSPITGKPLWFYPLGNPQQVNAAMGWAMDDNSVLFGTGYGIGIVRLDIKVEYKTKVIDGFEVNDDQWSVTKRWSTNRFRPKFNDFIVREGYLYGLDDGTLTCLDVEDGSIKWKSGRYGYGQLLLFDDVLLLMSESGTLYLIPATPQKPEPIASFEVLRSGNCWNNMAYARGRLLVRNASEAVCLDVSNTDESPASDTKQ